MSENEAYRQGFLHGFSEGRQVGAGTKAQQRVYSQPLSIPPVSSERFREQWRALTRAFDVASRVGRGR